MYHHNLPRSAARVVALAMLQHAPDVGREQFVFEGLDVGAEEDEIIEVIYTRRRKRSTLPVFEAVTLTAERLDYA